MNKYLKIGSFFLLIIFSSCENFLDKDPLDKFSENAVWTNCDLIEANLANLYKVTPFFDADNGDNAHITAFLGGESYCIHKPHNWINGTLNEQGGLYEFWNYNLIYNINTFIERIENSPMDKRLIDIRKSEARFLRAYDYFEMVKRYGGVPLILHTQSITDDYDELYVKRNSEKEVYDFIAKECDEIAAILPEVADEYGRVTKYTALALKSRAMLYAASIAQFGQPQLNGLLGFPKDEAAEYWQKSYDASKAIIESEKFALYNKQEDKSLNFQYLFLDERNSETIFAKVYGGKDKVGHDYDFRFYPEFLAKDFGGECCPYLDLVEDFEYINGHTGKLNYDSLTINLIDFNELFKDKDPRFFATIIYPGAKFAGKITLAHSGTRINGNMIMINTEVGIINDKPWYAIAPYAKIKNSGFGVRKYVDELVSPQPGPGESDTDYMVYRYGEILLNMAEAAFELNKEDEALKYINMVRERAGVKSRDHLNREMIHNERNVELAFEGHKYWDLRRWRIAVDELSKEKMGIEIYMNWESKKYEVVLKKVDLVDRFFADRMYYFPITTKRISNNPNLAPENPGY